MSAVIEGIGRSECAEEEAHSDAANKQLMWEMRV